VVEGMSGGEDENQDGVIPGSPVAVIKLAGIGDRRLGKVVSSFEGGAGIVIASWICERKTFQGIGAIARVEGHC